jgi:CMP-N,N'-diacetyllegionaminic acid synthase
MENEKILCVISARGGSQGVPKKNIRPLLGKPLIEWAIEKALAISCIDRVVVSTDSDKIAEISRRAGAEIPFIRPSSLALPTSGKFQVWQHALQACEFFYKNTYDLYIDIDCTNPLIEIADIKGALQLFQSLRKDFHFPDAVFTVSEARRNPYFNLVEPNTEGLMKMSKTTKDNTILARQLAPPVFEHVAGTYVLSSKYIRSANHLLDGRAFGYQIPPCRAFDIDSELDFKIIEFLLKSQKNLN